MRTLVRILVHGC